MAELSEDYAQAEPAHASWRRGLGWRIFLGLLVLVAIAIAYGWISREQLAGNLIESQLADMGLEAQYEIESVGPKRQVITNIVVGDPTRPDLTIERAEVTLEAQFPFVGVGKLKLVRPRVYGSYLEGVLSFGSLDPVLFKESDEPFAFPDMQLEIDDARALIETDYGPVGLKAAGSGHLQGGFEGVLAATAPAIALNACEAKGATLYGKVTIDAERPGFAGPLRLASLDCAGGATSLRNAALEIDAQVDRNLEGIEGSAKLAGGQLRLEGSRVDALHGSTQFAWRDNALTAEYGLAVEGADTPQFALASLTLDGAARSREGFGRVEIEAKIEGIGLRPGDGLTEDLASAASATSASLAGPMLERMRVALEREGQASTLSAEVSLRKTGSVLSLVMPQARWRGTSGATLLAVSRFQLASGDSSGLRFSGNFTTGGRDLPRITGRMRSRGGARDAIFNLRMAEYETEGASLEIPELEIAHGRSGSYGFAGEVRASGPFPGGSASGLRVPVRGSWSAGSGLTMWRQCVSLAFDMLEIANLTLDKREVELCPKEGRAILRSSGSGLTIAALSPEIQLSGRLGESPVRLASKALDISYPGETRFGEVDVALGESSATNRFKLGELTLAFDGIIGGRFARTDVLLDAVPLDIFDASGVWAYDNGKLDLADGRFQLDDRQRPGRFERLTARGATLILKNNVINAEALLREPRSDRAVTRATIVHSLDSGIGHADLAVEGLLFDNRLQPDGLTNLALGLIANAEGMVTGSGRIDWDPENLSSTGQFATKDFDFAAAFGPVEGVSGTITFTDLLGMVTAPDQKLRIRAFNPGIQVDEGEMSYELRENYLLAIKGGRWPFLGGFLQLEPTDLRMTEAEPRRYTLQMEGIDAAHFVERMDLANLAATGSFNGRLPLVFDQDGGRIEDGYLLSRPPGGNVSYVGDLTYADLTPIANYAFASLRSLDYRTMEVLFDGPLTGEIVTQVRFDGIRQGSDVKKNIITRQLAKLPIKFNVNIRAPFYQLITSFKALYDPAFIQDPRVVGLMDSQGNAIGQEAISMPVAIKPEDLPEDNSVIQSPESEDAQ